MRSASIVHRIGLVLASLLAAAAIGWTAFQLQQQQVLPAFLFPLLFPILLGAAVGTTCAALLYQARLGIAAALVVAVGAGLTAVAAEVLTGYQYYVAAVERQFHNNPMAMLARSASDDFAPASLTRFVAKRIRSGWWIADALLTVAASTVGCWFVLATRGNSLQAVPPETP